MNWEDKKFGETDSLLHLSPHEKWKKTFAKIIVLGQSFVDFRR